MAKRIDPPPGKLTLSASERIRQRKTEIIALFLKRVRREISEAKRQRDSILIDQMPEFLDDLAVQLSASKESFQIEKRSDISAKAHGAERAELTKFSIEQLIFEHQILRKILFEILEEEGTLSLEERDDILDAIESALKATLIEYLNVQTQKNDRRIIKSFRFPVKQLITLVLVGFATFLQWLIWPIINPAPYTLFYPAIIIGALCGDGYFAAVLSALAAQYFFVHHESSLTFIWPDDLVRMILFLINASTITFVARSLNKARTEALMASSEQAKLKSQADRAIDELHYEREAREQIIAMVSHDLRNPLSAVRNNIELLIRHNDNRHFREVIPLRIIQSLDRIERMIKDFLDAHRVKAGQNLSLEVGSFELNTLAKEVVEEFSVIYGNRFVLKGNNSISGYWSWDGLRRTLENLLSNAVKYGSPETPITLKLIQTPDRVQIQVHNEGDPISPEDQDNLFNPYRRTKSAVRSGKKGWGIGLTLVRGVVQAHGGKVLVESAPHRGTTFILDLPRDARTYQIEAA